MNGTHHAGGAWPASGLGRVRRGALALLVAAATCVGASGAAGHGATHGDDFTSGQEVPAPATAAPAPLPPALSTVTATRAAAVTGSRSVAVVMLNFASLPSTPWTADQVRTAVFTGPGSVNAFEQEQSFGALNLTGILSTDGDVFGWYTIAASTSVCDPDLWMSQANAAAAAAGVDLAGYQHHIYLFPSVGACGWAGLADMPGRDSFINGTISTRVMAHELGHNLGAQHASTISCLDGGGVRVVFSGTCTVSEYGDPFDVMGSTDRQSAAFRKVGYGFIPAAATTTVTQTGTYQLASASLAVGGVRSLRVTRPGSADYWYLELRSPTGVFDDYGVADPAVTGVGIRLANEYGTAARTRLVDTTPATATYADAPLQPGQQFTDPVSGVSIAVDVVALGMATIRVTVPGSTPVPSAGGTPPPTSGGGAPPPPGTIVTPSAPRVVISARRVRAGRLLVRVSLPAPAGAGRCAARVGGVRWSRCRILPGGSVAFARLVSVRPGAVNLVAAVRFDKGSNVAVRLRLSASGRAVKVVRALP